MASTFSLPSITNGDISDVDLIYSHHSFILANMLNLIIDGAVKTNQENFVLINSGLMELDGSLSSNITTENGKIYSCYNYDNFNGTTPNTNRYTTSTAGLGTVTEAGGTLTIDGGEPNSTGSLVTNGAIDPLNPRNWNSNGEVVLHVYTNQIGAVTTAFGLTDLAGQRDNIKGGVFNSEYRIVFDKQSGSTATIYEDGVLFSKINLSSYSNWFLEFYAQNTTEVGALGRVNVSFIGYSDGTSGTSRYISAVKTIPNSTNSIITKIIDDSGSISSTGTLSYSADSGINYVTSTGDKVLTRLNSIGTEFRMKIDSDIKSVASGTLKTIESINTIAYYYG